MVENVADKDDRVANNAPRSLSRMPSDSLFYGRLVPVILIVLGIVMFVLIIIALGVLLGIVPFQ